MTDYSKITALYSRLSVGDEDRDGGESNSTQNQKIFLENYARGQHLTNRPCRPFDRQRNICGAGRVAPARFLL